jgi:hypothetical protein
MQSGLLVYRRTTLNTHIYALPADPAKQAFFCMVETTFSWFRLSVELETHSSSESISVKGWLRQKVALQESINALLVTAWKNNPFKYALCSARCCTCRLLKLRSLAAWQSPPSEGEFIRVGEVCWRAEAEGSYLLQSILDQGTQCRIAFRSIW